MRRKLLGIMIIVIGVACLLCGCASSQKKRNKTDSKELLKQIGWTAENRYGLGLYAPFNEMDWEEDPMAHADNVQYSEFGVGHDAEYGTAIFSIYKHKDEGIVFNDSNVEYMLKDIDRHDGSDTTYPISLIKETKEIYIYEQPIKEVNGEKYNLYELYVLCKGTGIYYWIRIYNDAWEEIHDLVSFNEDKYDDFEKGHFFTKERYQAFIDNLQYLGDSQQ